MTTFEYSCIKMVEARNAPTSTVVHIQNNDKETPLVYKIKTNIPRWFNLTPCAVGLLPPEGRQNFEIQLLPNYSFDLDIPYFVLETAFCLKTDDGHPQTDAARAWEEIVSTDIVVTRIPIIVREPMSIDGRGQLKIQLGKNPDVLRKTVVERISSVKERIQNEELTTDVLLLVLTVLGAGFVVGYMIRKSESPCPNLGGLCQASHPL